MNWRVTYMSLSTEVFIFWGVSQLFCNALFLFVLDHGIHMCLPIHRNTERRGCICLSSTRCAKRLGQTHPWTLQPDRSQLVSPDPLHPTSCNPIRLRCIFLSFCEVDIPTSPLRIQETAPDRCIQTCQGTRQWIWGSTWPCKYEPSR